MKECTFCNRRTFCDEHHPDKENRPDWTVTLCLSCHRECHTGFLVFYDNRYIRAASEWQKQEFQSGRFIHPRQLRDKALELGYVPLHDWQINLGYQSLTEFHDAVLSGELTQSHIDKTVEDAHRSKMEEYENDS